MIAPAATHSRILAGTRGHPSRIPSVHRVLAELARTLMEALFDPYRPEMHYMRGPGPKWQEQQRRASSSHAGAANDRRANSSEAMVASTQR
jgi:hypothetical protein